MLKLHKQTDPFITDPFITGPFIIDNVHNGSVLNVVRYTNVVCDELVC